MAGELGYYYVSHGPKQVAENLGRVGGLSGRNVLLLGIGIAVALYLLTFGRGLDNYFTGDDWAFLDEVSRVHSLSDLAAFFTFATPILVRPLEKVITWLVLSGFGLNFVVFHAFSLLLDLTNTVLLGVLAFILFRSELRPDRQSLFWAAAVGILFAFNWTHHEAVFWYSALNEPLTAFFRLSGILLYVLLLTRRELNAWVAGAVVGACALLALFSKESAVVFPLELLLFFLYFKVARREHPVRWREVIMLALVSAVVGIWIFLYWTGSPPGVIQNGRGGVKLTLGSPEDWFLRVPLLFNSTILGLHVFSTESRLRLELLLGLVLVAAAIVRRRFVWLLALAWTIALALPYAALFPANIMLAYLKVTGLTEPDRYFYYITAGASLFLVAAVMWLVEEIQARIPNRSLHVGAYVLVCLAFVGLVAFNSVKILNEENEWDVTGQTVRTVSRQLESVIAGLRHGDTLCLANLPDNFKFKLSFRNATQGVLYLTYHRSDYAIMATTDQDPPTPPDHCTVWLRYDPAANKFAAQ